MGGRHGGEGRNRSQRLLFKGIHRSRFFRDIPSRLMPIFLQHFFICHVGGNAYIDGRERVSKIVYTYDRMGKAESLTRIHLLWHQLPISSFQLKTEEEINVMKQLKQKEAEEEEQLKAEKREEMRRRKEEIQKKAEWKKKTEGDGVINDEL